MSRADTRAPRARRTTTSTGSRGGIRSRATVVVGITYLLLCFAFLLNSALSRNGLPSLSVGGGTPNSPLGRTGLVTLGGLGLGVALIGALSRRLTARQWLLAGLIGLWLAGPGLSLAARTGSWNSALLGAAATGVGVAAASGLAGARATRWVLFVVGIIWSAGSLLLGALALQSPTLLPKVLVTDPFDRFTQWTRMLGLDTAEGATKALVGLGMHRNLLAMALALLLVIQLRHVLTVRTRWPGRVLLLLVGPLLTSLPLAWTLSRTSILAAAVGALVAFLPVERVSRRWIRMALSAVPAVAVMVPVLAREEILAALEPGTMRWRALLWQGLLDAPGTWGLWGRLPVDVIVIGDIRARHAHNQAVEALVRGGVVSAAALLAVALIGTYVAISVAGRDGRATFAAVMTGAVICTTEVIGTTPSNAAAIILIAMVVSAAGLEHQGQARPSDRAGVRSAPARDSAMSADGARAVA